MGIKEFWKLVCKESMAQSVKWVLTGLGGIGLAIWSYLDQFSVPVSIIFGLVTILLILLIWLLCRHLLSGQNIFQFLSVGSGSSEQTKSLAFSDPLAPPGWVFKSVDQELGGPEMESVEIGGKRAVEIRTKKVGLESYALDYRFPRPLSEISEIDFEVNGLGPDAVLYIMLLVKKRDSKEFDNLEELWFQFELKTKESKRRLADSVEWELNITPTKIDVNWLVYKVDIRYWFRETWEKLGFELVGISGFRLRGSMIIHEIRWK